jgi:hypothetical protein
MDTLMRNQEGKRVYHGHDTIPTRRVDVSAPEQMYAALKVLTETDHIANYLALHDPKAMEQANVAMTAYEASTKANAWVEVPNEAMPVDNHCEEDGSRFCLVHNAPYNDDGDVCQDANV